MKGSASFPITPATTLRVPTCRGTTLRATEETPEAAQETVVEGSPAAALAVQPAEEPPALKSTAGWKITVMAVPDAPAGAKNSTTTIKGAPTFPPAGAEKRVTERSWECAIRRAARTHAMPAASPALRVDRAPAMRPPFDAFQTPDCLIQEDRDGPL